MELSQTENAGLAQTRRSLRSELVMKDEWDQIIDDLREGKIILREAKQRITALGEKEGRSAKEFAVLYKVALNIYRLKKLESLQAKAESKGLSASEVRRVLSGLAGV